MTDSFPNIIENKNQDNEFNVTEDSLYERQTIINLKQGQYVFIQTRFGSRRGYMCEADKLIAANDTFLTKISIPNQI